MQRLKALIGSAAWARYLRSYGLAAIAALLETGSIAAVFPVVTRIASAGDAAASVGLAVIGLGAVYVAGLALRAYAVHQSARTTQAEGYAFSARLFQRALEQPYAWNFSHHSADLRSAILSDAQDLIYGVFAPLGRLIAQLTLVVAVTCVLLVIQPVATLIFGAAIVAIYLATFALLRGPLKRDGERQMTAHQTRHRLSAEAFQAARELRLSHLEGRFAAAFATASDDLARAGTNRAVYTELPKLVLEAIIFGLLAWFALHIVASDQAVAAGNLPTLVLFAAAGLKLFPMGHLVFANLSLLRAGWPIVGKFEGLLGGLQGPAADDPCPALTTNLELDEVGYSYPGQAGPVISGISLRVQPGQKVAVIGPSGAGKSTLIDVIAGLLSPDSGQVLIDGVPRTASQSRDWQKQLRYSPQTPTLFDQSIAENIILGAGYPEHQLAAAVHLACLDDAVAGQVGTVGEQGRNLSGGQIKRISIARALLDDVAVYLLDEPTSNLDTDTAAKVMARVFAARPKAMFFIVTHDAGLAGQCDIVVDLGKPGGR